MADEPVGPYQIPKIASDDPVQRVRFFDALAVAINNALGVVRGQAAGDAAVDAATKYVPLSRGVLAPGQDLDTYTSATQNGVYGIPLAGIVNAPPITTAGVFEFHRVVGSTFSAVQRVWSDGDMWWREAFDLAAGSEKLWGAWQKVATTGSLTGYVRSNFGPLPAGADLDTYTTVPQSGIYSIPSSGILNAPPISNAGVFEAYRVKGNNYSCLQRVTNGDVMWWREAFDLSDGSPKLWGPWNRVLTESDRGTMMTSPTALRIITSTDPYQSLDDGDILIVLAEEP